ncbi:MAG: Holliday junction resolvase RuvX [Bacteroidota bacterium]|nr:Holliday junction resolvase RuvX [Bacteroidota bacterium]
MKRILAIDYGKRRVGLAMTDLMQMLAIPLDTIDTNKIIPYLKNLFLKEPIACIVLGFPLNMDGQDTDATPLVNAFEILLKENFPETPIHRIDERLTSKMAKQTLIDAGYKKKDRKNKKLVDTVAAALILQTYLETK